MGGGKVWTTAFDGTSRVDPSNGRITKIGDYAGPIGIAATRTTAYAVDGNHLDHHRRRDRNTETVRRHHKSRRRSGTDRRGAQRVWVPHQTRSTTCRVWAQLWTANGVDVHPGPRGRGARARGRDRDGHRRRECVGGRRRPRSPAVANEHSWKRSDRDAAGSHASDIPRRRGVWIRGALGHGPDLQSSVPDRSAHAAHDLDAITVGREPMGVAVGAGAVWVTNAIDGTVSGTNPDTGRTVATIPVGGSPTSVAVGAGSVWVAVEAVSRRPRWTLLALTCLTVVAVACGGSSKSHPSLRFGSGRSSTAATAAAASCPERAPNCRCSHTVPSSAVHFRPTASPTPRSRNDRSSSSSSASSRAFPAACCSHWPGLWSAVTLTSCSGPPHPDDGLAVREYARHHPKTTFMLTSYEQSSTLKRHAPNVFRFQADASQWAGGAGTYAVQKLGWKRIATVAEGDPSGWPTTSGFDVEVCALGGRIVHPQWPFSLEDQGTLVDKLHHDDLDGVFLEGAQGTGSFIEKWRALYPHLGRHLIVGWLPLFHSRAQLVGVVGVSPIRSGQRRPGTATSTGSGATSDTCATPISSTRRITMGWRRCCRHLNRSAATSPMDSAG